VTVTEIINAKVKEANVAQAAADANRFIQKTLVFIG
jgi:hypothetical protein